MYDVNWFSTVATDIDGHIGFIAETTQGTISEVHYNGMFYDIPRQLRKEDSMRLMVEKIMQLKGENNG